MKRGKYMKYESNHYKRDGLNIYISNEGDVHAMQGQFETEVPEDLKDLVNAKRQKLNSLLLIDSDLSVLDDEQVL